MKRYIAYFDFLGYKSFILNNTSERLLIRANHILRDLELALALNNDLLPRGNVAIPDIGNVRINCLNISDTVIFWTMDDTLENLSELLAAANKFNWSQIHHDFPVRGAIICGEMEMLKGSETNVAGAVYSKNLIYGKGLISAHSKSENLNFAGCVIDSSVVLQIAATTDVSIFLEPYAKLYPVPYKSSETVMSDEYILNLVSRPLNEQAFINYSNNYEVVSPRITSQSTIQECRN